MDSTEEPVFPHARNLYGHPLAGLLWDAELERSTSQTKLGKVPTCEFLHALRKSQLFLSVHVDDMKDGQKERQIGTSVEKSVGRNRSGRSDPFAVGNRYHKLTFSALQL